MLTPETHTTEAIFDTSGRYIAPPQPCYRERPIGPWSLNFAAAPQCAVYAFHQPGWDHGPGFAMYTIRGGASDGSTVSAETLQELGIAVPGVWDTNRGSR